MKYYLASPFGNPDGQVESIMPALNIFLESVEANIIPVKRDEMNLQPKAQSIYITKHEVHRRTVQSEPQASMKFLTHSKPFGLDEVEHEPSW